MTTTKTLTASRARATSRTKPLTTFRSSLLDSLHDRWQSFRAELKRCQKKYSEEAVHDLRVATRKSWTASSEYFFWLRLSSARKDCQRSCRESNSMLRKVVRGLVREIARAREVVSVLVVVIAWPERVQGVLAVATPGEAQFLP